MYYMFRSSFSIDINCSISSGHCKT